MGFISELDIEEKYSNVYVITKRAVSTPNVLHRFDKINKGKSWGDQAGILLFQATEQDNYRIR